MKVMKVEYSSHEERISDVFTSRSRCEGNAYNVVGTVYTDFEVIYFGMVESILLNEVVRWQRMALKIGCYDIVDSAHLFHIWKRKSQEKRALMATKIESRIRQCLIQALYFTRLMILESYRSIKTPLLIVS